MATRVTTYRFTPQDHKDITAIREKYGLANDTDAIRMALRVVAKSMQKKPTPTPDYAAAKFFHEMGL